MKDDSAWLTLLCRVYSWFMHRWHGARKELLFRDLEGKILEIGPGPGVNFRYYRPGSQVWAVEPEAALHYQLRQQAQVHQIKLTIVPSGAERLEFPNETFDQVVGTLVLCSVSSPEQVLAEVARVLKPSGCYCFLEHVAAPSGSFLCLLQRTIKKPWKRVFQGCQVCLRTKLLLKETPFVFKWIQEFRLGTSLLPIRPHLIGIAMKPPPS